MSASAGHTHPLSRKAGAVMVAGGVLLLVAAGVVLWARHGDAVFASYLQAALAWCF